MSGAHVNIADEKGRTPLHIAAELGDPVLSDRVLIGGFNVLTCVRWALPQAATFLFVCTSILRGSLFPLGMDLIP